MKAGDMLALLIEWRGEEDMKIGVSRTNVLWRSQGSK